MGSCTHTMHRATVSSSRIRRIARSCCAMAGCRTQQFACHTKSLSCACSYGSSSDALIVQASPDAEPFARQIAALFNLRAHAVIERLSGARVTLHTPVTLELHRNPAYKGLVVWGEWHAPDALLPCHPHPAL